jgi:hypothetical protein
MPKEDPIMCVQVSGPEKAVRALIAKKTLLLEALKRDGERLVGFAYVRQSKIRFLKAPRIALKTLYDATALGKQRQKQVMRDNPFVDGSIPKGLGRLIKEDGNVS